MAADAELSSFTKDALQRGLSRKEIKDALLSAGWAPDQVKDALSAFADIAFPVPVPRPKPYLSARDAFMYLILFTTLYISAFNLGHLAFQFIDRAFPDPSAPSYIAQYSRYAIRWSVSSLIVAFPIFLYMSNRMSNAVAKDPIKRASKIRKWLTYLTLFITASFMIGDLIALVYNLLGGGLTWRFVLKVLTVAIIAGSIFGYYRWDLRHEEAETET